MKYDLVIWDFNGTIIDDVALGISSVNTMLAKRSLPVLESADEYRAKLRFPIIDYYRSLGFDFGAEPYDVLAREWVELYNAGEDKCAACTGAADAVHRIREAGIEQQILSASERGMLIASLRRLGLEGYFDEIYAQDNFYAEGKLGTAKAIASRFGERRAVMLGDTVHDFETARIIGADCILFTGGHGMYSDLAACRVPLVSDLREAADIILG